MKRTLTIALAAAFILALLELSITIACKTQGPAPKPTGQGEARAAAESTQSALQMTLTTDPQELKDGKQFTMRVRVTDQAGKPVSDAALSGSLVMTTMDMGKNDFEFTAKGDGNYEAIATPSMAGPWQITVKAKRGADLGSKNFPVAVKE